MNKRSQSASDEQLDQLLKSWAAEQQPAPEQLAALCERIQLSSRTVAQDNVEGDVHGRLSVDPARSSRIDMRSRAILVLGTLAASTLLCCVLWNPLQRIDDQRNNRASANASSVDTERSADVTTSTNRGSAIQALADSNFNYQRQLIEKLRSVYGHTLMWIAESGDELHVELSGAVDQAEVDAKQPWLLIRLAVEQQGPTVAADAKDSQPLWQIDLAVRNQQTISLKEGSQKDSQVTVWPCMTDDGLVMIDTQFAELGPVKGAGNQTNLVRPGTRTRLTSVDDQYALWQYVEVVY